MRVTAWCSFMTDLSGRPVSEADWHTELSPTTGALLHELGRHYAPFLVANAESLGRVSFLFVLTFFCACVFFLHEQNQIARPFAGRARTV